MKTHRDAFRVLTFCSVALAATTPAPAAWAQMQSPSQPLTFEAHADPWPSARPRFFDIRNNAFNGFLTQGQEFSYENVYSTNASGAPVWNTQVTLTYDKTPATPYFVGRIEARGLKPNFAYQIKLLGKPQKGRLNWGTHGDEVGNERIGYAGRWWCDTNHSTATNFDDSHFVNAYKNAAPGTEHSMYGYLFSGVFVTNSRGDASIDISGRNSYHITWQSWQNGRKDVLAGTWNVQSWLRDSSSLSPYYGYGSSAITTAPVTLYYEYETGRPQPVSLAAGTYNCRMVLTEESFHNDKNTTPNGGYWQGVLSTEEVGDDSPENDIVFTVSAPAIPATPTTLAAKALGGTSIGLSWADTSDNETGFRIERSRSGGIWSSLVTLGANATSFTDSRLLRNTLYAYRVSSYNAAGQSPHSTVASARTFK